MILFSCRRVVQLTSKELDARLRLTELVCAGGHRLLCGQCRLYRQQLHAIEAAVREYLREAPGRGDERLPDDAKARIRDLLKEGSA